MAEIIARRMKSLLAEKATAHRVVDVRVGLGYTGVRIDTGSVGLAYTLRDDVPHGCSVFALKRPMVGKSAAALLDYLGSADRVEFAVGLATLNALTNTGAVRADDGDVLEAIRLQPDDEVGMVGYFGPLVPKIRGRVRSLSIFETVKTKSRDLLPEEQSYEILPRCSVALITSTSLINGTIEKLLAAGANCREVVLLGASTPLLPEAFADTPVTCLSGVIVTDPEGILQIVSEAGGMRAFRGGVRKVNVRRSS